MAQQAGCPLLNLPRELLGLILLELDPGSFSMILGTCKAIRDHAGSSAKLLRQQLLRVPGLRPTYGLSNLELLEKFKSRAARHMLNGVEARMNVVVFRPSETIEDTLWSRNAFNQLCRCCSNTCDRGALATAVDGDGTVHIYGIRKGLVTPMFHLYVCRVCCCAI
jgi:hypothetical protein